MLTQFPQRVDLEPNLGQAGHVVQHQRQRQFVDHVGDVASQFGLAGRKIVGRRKHGGGRAGIFCHTGKFDGLDKRRVGDSNQDRDSIAHNSADQTNEVTTKSIAKTRSLAGRAENEYTCDATGDHMLEQSLCALLIDGVAVDKGRDQRRNDSAQSCGGVGIG